MPHEHPCLQIFGAILGFFVSLEFFQNGFKTILMGAFWALGIWAMNKTIRYFEYRNKKRLKK